MDHFDEAPSQTIFTVEVCDKEPEFFVRAIHYAMVDIADMLEGWLLIGVGQLTRGSSYSIGECCDVVLEERQLNL